MFCTKCGAENDNDANFCERCGKPIKNGLNQANNSVQSMNYTNLGRTNSMTQSVNQNVRRKTISNKMIIGAIILIIAVVVGYKVIDNIGRTINLDKYIYVQSEGYDGFGSGYVAIDWEAMENTYGSKISFTNAAKKEYGGFMNIMTPLDALNEAVTLHYDYVEDLSNGDKIKYHWEIDEKKLQCVNCKLKFQDGEATVSGLKETEKYDVFGNMIVKFEGIEPNGTVQVDYAENNEIYYSYSFDKRDGLKNGDVITLTIDKDDAIYYLSQYGKAPLEMEKQYTVQGLDTYLKESKDIDNDILEEMKNVGLESFKNLIEEYNYEGGELQSLDYVGLYFLRNKKEELSNGNSLYLVYKAKVRNYYSNDSDNFDEINDIYWYISYKNLIVDKDGKLDIDINFYYSPVEFFYIDSGIDDGWWGTISWGYYGYPSLEDLYKKEIEDDLDNYNCEEVIDKSL